MPFLLHCRYITPVMFTDSTGYIANWVLGGIIGGVVGAISSLIMYGEIDWNWVLAGAIGGALIGSGIGLLKAGKIASKLICGYAISSGISQGTSNYSNGQPLLKNVFGATAGGALSASTLWLAQPLAAGANAILNEFENEIFWDNDYERFSWDGVIYDATAYTFANILTKGTNSFLSGRGVVQWNGYLVAGIYDTIIYGYGDRFKDDVLAFIWR